MFTRREASLTLYGNDTNVHSDLQSHLFLLILNCIADIRRYYVCMSLQDGIRAIAEPSSTSLTEIRSWLESRQLDDGHRLERQRRCGKNIHNYPPLNTVAIWIIDTPRLHASLYLSLTSSFTSLRLLLFCPVVVSLLGNIARSRNWHKVSRQPSYPPYEFFYFHALTSTDRPPCRSKRALVFTAVYEINIHYFYNLPIIASYWILIPSQVLILHDTEFEIIKFSYYHVI